MRFFYASNLIGNVMSDFLDILTHGRRLQGAVKDLTVEELGKLRISPAI